MIGTLDKKTMMMIAGAVVALAVCYYLYKETRNLKAELGTTKNTLVEMRKYLEPIPVVTEEPQPVQQAQQPQATAQVEEAAPESEENETD